jgi:DNA invertase Pin-like site-specific DNA recombinase
MKIPKSEYENIISMKRSGMKHKDIAKVYEVDSSTITEILIKCGIRTNTTTNTPVPKSAHDEIIKLYEDGNSQETIAKIYNTSSKNIGNILKKHGVQCRHQPLSFSEEDIVKMYNMYCSRIKIQDIAKQYHIDVTSVYNLFKRNGLTIREFCDSRREYEIDTNYFDSIDTANKAYILGLFYADGCNKLSKHQMDISLQEEDKHILEDIKRELKTNRPLSFVDYNTKNPNHKNQYKLSITNKHISQKLNELGMVDAKSLVLEFPEWLDESLYSHFIRGYFDGDGCLYLGGTKAHPEVSIVSTIMFVRKVKDILANAIDVDMRIKTQKQHKPVTKVGVITGIGKIVAFLDWIYVDADLKLNRKYEKYKQFLERYCDNINNSCLN